MTEPSDGAESRQRPAELRIPFRDLLIADVLSLLCRLRREQLAWQICSRAISSVTST